MGLLTLAIESVLSKEYSEGPSSTATHNNADYSLDILFKLSKNYPIVQLKVKDLEWVLKYADTDKKRVERADITIPLLVYNDPVYHLTVIDGAHRLTKAKQLHLKTIPCRILTDSDMKRAKL